MVTAERDDAGRVAVAATIRMEGPRILATLIRTIGDVQVAEDAVQEATVAALGAWSVGGIPPEPRAWLTAVARRKAIDILRRERIRPDRERDALRLIALAQQDVPPDHVVDDDLLRLIFTCCHPTLSPQTRVALALRTLCGLSPAQIGAVLLTTEDATAKRLTRARQKIAAAHIPYRVPDPDAMADRLPAVCAVIHGLYTAGHAPIDGPDVSDVDAASEAVRLAELLHGLLPSQPMPAAVLALLLLTEARRPARLDDRGELVPLESQDRSRWDAVAIDRGVALLNDSLRRTGRQADAYQLQAAIAAEHGRAADHGATDRAEILRLYDLLVSIAPSPAVELARVVATAEAVGPGPRWPCWTPSRSAPAGTWCGPSCWPVSVGTPRRPGRWMPRSSARRTTRSVATGSDGVPSSTPSARIDRRPEMADAAAHSTDDVFAAVNRRVLVQFPNDEHGRMLRSPGLRTSGRFYAFASTDHLVVKLPAARVAEMIGNGTGVECSPRPGHPMREWVQLPAPDEGTCLAVVLEARSFVAGL